jgi:hypothetical protein
MGGVKMKIKIQVTVESNEGQSEAVREVARLERGALRPEELGLTLAEARAILAGIQQVMTEQQASEFVARQQCCADCGKPRAHKGRHEIVVRTPFGKLKLKSPGFYHCGCQGTGRTSFSPLAELLPERTSAELLYLETKFASLLPYGVTLGILKEILPISEDLSTTAIRQNVTRIAERMEGELGEERVMFIEGCERDWEALPEPGPPLTVGMDGGYVHARDQKSRQEGWFEVIVGKSIPAEGDSKCFGFVHRLDPKPKRRLFATLKSQGLQMNQAVTFLSDGGDTVRDLQMYMSPQAEHLLDWFHVTMRLTVMGQMAKGLATAVKPPTAAEGEREGVLDVPEIEKNLKRLKWNLWHGNVYRALQLVEDLQVDLQFLEAPSENIKKLLKAAREFGGYIAANRVFIPNYGDRYRHGERISTAFVESTVDQVISKRFAKKQQMTWTERGAHLLLQVRTQTLNSDLRAKFRAWYPGMKESEEVVRKAA